MDYLEIAQNYPEAAATTDKLCGFIETRVFDEIYSGFVKKTKEFNLEISLEEEELREIVSENIEPILQYLMENCNWEKFVNSRQEEE